jgi:hypothetical protein
MCGLPPDREVMTWEWAKCSVGDCNEEVTVSGLCVAHRVVFRVGEEVMVIRTQKTHTVTAVTPGSPASSYVLDNGTGYWDFELMKHVHGSVEYKGLAKS